MQLPGPVRAVVGLFAVAAEEAKHLPDRAIELPMLAVSSALQMSLRAQQRYARLAARGDDVLNRRPPSDEPPAWATFDDPVGSDELRGLGLHDPDPALRAAAATQLLDELLGAGPSGSDGAYPDEPREPKPAAKKAPPAKTAKKAPAKQVAAKKGTAEKVAAEKPAKSAAATRKAPANKTSAARKSSTSKTAGKTINRPRHTSPSRFDTVDDH